MFMRPSTKWAPILVGDDAAEAETSVLEIAEDLSREEWSPELLAPNLAAGNAGLALFFHEVHHRWPRPTYKVRRDRHWNAAIDGLEQSEFIPPNLYSGFTGVGWATTLLCSDGTSADEGVSEEAHAELEEALLEILGDMPDPATYDLINGPVGWGLYALERWPHPRATRALELIVDFLANRAERVPQGTRWWTSPETLPAWQRERSPNGYYNVGLSHGIPGICVLLSQTLARRIRPDVCAPLLRGAVDWVLSQQIAGTSGLSFPGSVAMDTSPVPSRLAWCYGDLGVSAALWVAGDVSDNESWKDSGVSIARGAAAIPRDASGAVDPGLCHGASGIAHIFNRFYQVTREPAFGSAARTWIRIALEMRRDGIGPGRYAAWKTEPIRGWAPTPGLLEGSAGIGLALLAAIGDREPVWDRFLFVSPVPILAAGDNS